MIGTSPVVCKLCRYYSNLLLKPPEGKSQKAMFAKNYRKRYVKVTHRAIFVNANNQPFLQTSSIQQCGGYR